MPKKRVVTQFGMGTSIRSRNYTEAAARAIRDALWHNSLNVADAFGFPREAMLIDVEIGVQEPDKVDLAVVAAELPRGRAEVTAVHGGLNVHDTEQQTTHVIATAAVEAFVPILTAQWRLSGGG